MERRTYEGPMDWEYNGSRPVDQSSPFAQVASGGSQSSRSSQGSPDSWLAARLNNGAAVFASPPKPSARPNPFAQLSTPSRSQEPPPQSARFTPQLSSKNTAPPFRNPAFTTPRRPFDEVVFSEASGAEDSPVPAETFDSPNDTPDVDRMSDLNMGGTVTPAKVDKAFRYGKSAPTAKKHTPGKGEIRNHRDFSVGDIIRKRKRHNHDRDVSSVARHQREGWDDSEENSEDSFESRPNNRSRNKKKPPKQKGWVHGIFHTLNENPNAPDNIYRWIQLLINVALVSGFFCICYGVVDTIRSDIKNANESARMELMSRMTECQNQYTMNECSKKDRPALRVMCDEWYDCMMQNPESIMRVKVTVVQMGQIMSDFADVVNIKAWAFILSIFLVCACANNMAIGRHGTNNSAPAAPSQPAAGPYERTMPPESTPGAMWVQVQTPRMHRHALLEDETDTDASPPPMRPMLPPYTPSGRRSPSKGERPRSPTKYARSPTKYGRSPAKDY